MRKALILSALFALAVRALVPAGWMPVAAEGFGLRLVPCSGWGPEQAPAAASHHHHGSPGQSDPGGGDQHKTDQPCAFAGLAQSATGASPAPALPAPPPVAPAALPALPSAAARPGLAAPPPPPTGPPSA